ncbi:exonuclease 1 [Trichogramma pretiosum]|uniref:exonuclease 1 n=1 Tax=Trichogramma pretiosum TaxID=7493 RepID=UPI0006C9C448|nr:exonuclease 1 [Trichogramma pretiosum]
MGITGLIPFLEKSSRKTNISEFSGGTVAIDTYCWLHKGAFSCADKIIMGQATDAYVKYCMKFVNMLLGHNIKPILVFDGRHLPAKADTEVKRRENRQANRKRAAELIKMGKTNEGRNLLRRSLDVSHKMALEVIKVCQAQNVDCIVAPYEADAQLAYLNISGIADVIITEDSDLTLFGCKKIFFKMDLYGHGVLVEQERLHLAMGLTPPNFSIDKFRYMCILSGCDYLASLPGIGLNKACKFIVKNTDNNIYNALLRLSSSLNMKQLVVTQEYRDGFMRALVTFKHQLVFCPIRRKQVRLYEPTSEVTTEQLVHAGSEVDPDMAYQLALGNLDPFSFKKMHDFDPSFLRSRKTNAWSDLMIAEHPSIWSKEYKIKQNKESQSIAPEKKENYLPAVIKSSKGKVGVIKTDFLKKEITPRKRTYEEAEMDTDMDDIINLYKETAREKTPPRSTSTASMKSPVNKASNKQSESAASPVLTQRRRSNPFRRTSLKLPERCRLRPTVIDSSAIQCSKFFALKKVENDATESMAVNVDDNDLKNNVKTMVENQKQMIIPETEDVEIDIPPVNPLERSVLVEDTQDISPLLNECKKKNMKTAAFIPETQNLDISMAYQEDNCHIIPETECFDSTPNNAPNELHRQDSGYKSLDMSVDEDKSQRVLDDALMESQPGLKEDDEDDELMVLRIVPQVFAEERSSMFAHNSPLKKPKNSQNSSGWIHSGQQKSWKQNLIKTKKEKPVLRGQQSLFNYFSR